MKHEGKTGKVKTPKSINHILLKNFLLLATLLILLVEVICYFIVSNTAEARARDRLTNMAMDISAILKVNNDMAVSDFMRSYRGEGINAYILNADGEVLLPFNAEKDWVSSVEQIKNRLEGKNGSPVIYVENNYINCVKFINHGEKTYFVANYSLVILKDSLNKLIIYFIVVGVLVLMLAAIVSYSISQRLASGIKNLSTTAVKFSKGDFNVNFAHAEYQELADLSETLNVVRDEVKKSGDFQREILANVSHDLKTPLTLFKPLRLD